MPHLVLFTPFHPDFGGGATYFHSTLAALDGVTITWAYLGTPGTRQPHTVCLGPRLIGGPILTDLFRSARLWITGSLGSRTRRIVDGLLQLKADAYWIVPMHESIPIALALLDRSPAPLHLSVQDDQCDAIATRSRRYRHLLPWMRKQWLQLMRRARSIDVCSSGMKARYEAEYGLISQVFHPYVPQFAALPPVALDQTHLTVGHLGSVYSSEEWLSFVHGLDAAGKAMGQRVRLRLIGPSGIPLERTRQILGASQVEVIPYQQEADSLPLLKDCHFLYAMYPFDAASRVFRQTSLPSKLAAYLRAQRPVFAHTPADSTLSARVEEASLGVVCPSLATADISAAIQTLVHSPAPVPGVFEAARERFYGFHHVQQMQSTLQALALAS